MKSIILTFLIIIILSTSAFSQVLPGLQVGTKAPDFEALNYEGNQVRLSSLYAKGPVILVFYRGGWCPYCNIQLKDLQAHLDRFKEYNATLVAVSVDQPEKGAETVGGLGLGFDVISDQQVQILKDYNLVNQVPEDIFKMYKDNYKIDLEAASGNRKHVIAIPATMIIDQRGLIVFSYANEDYKVRTSSEEILKELKKLEGDTSDISFYPINHATMAIEAKGLNILIDPVNEEEPLALNKFADPDLILVTDIHHDHLDADVINQLKGESTIVVGPKEVIDQLGFGEVLKNGMVVGYKDVMVEAIPMYNVTADRLKFHPKGRGNGYVLTINDKRIYISGDTEDIPQMRALTDIDYAFVCMNLPYTMTVEQAASAVLEFKPKVVIPYHYRGNGGLSDINRFKDLVSVDGGIEVRFLDWY